MLSILQAKRGFGWSEAQTDSRQQRTKAINRWTLTSKYTGWGVIVRVKSDMDRHTDPDLTPE